MLLEKEHWRTWHLLVVRVNYIRIDRILWLVYLAKRKFHLIAVITLIIINIMLSVVSIIFSSDSLFILQLIEFIIFILQWRWPMIRECIIKVILVLQFFLDFKYISWFRLAWGQQKFIIIYRMQLLLLTSTGSWRAVIL